MREVRNTTLSISAQSKIQNDVNHPESIHLLSGSVSRHSILYSKTLNNRRGPNFLYGERAFPIFFVATVSLETSVASLLSARGNGEAPQANQANATPACVYL